MKSQKRGRPVHLPVEAPGQMITGGAELLEDRTTRLHPSVNDSLSTGIGRSRRAGLGAGGAIVGTLLVATLALGAAAGQDGLFGGGRGQDRTGAGAVSEPTNEATQAADGDSAHGTTDGTTDGTDGSGDGIDGIDGVGETEPTAAPDWDATPEATSEPTATEPPADPEPPAIRNIEIGVGIDNVYPAIEWSHCSVDGFTAYKVVRSTNEGVTWPLGSGDVLVGTLKEATSGRFVDRTVKAGTASHYRVVALRNWSGEAIVACQSAVRAITTPAPDPTPAPVGSLEISVTLSDGGHPVIDWSTCSGAAFSYYKVVRSTDSTITWPAGENDTLVAVVGPDGDTIRMDGDAPGGAKLYYRVFCVRAAESGYVIVAKSDVRAIETPAAELAPDAVSLGLEASVGGEGVVLTWQQCTSDAFHWYKVVRSTTNENPSYLPHTDGSELIGVIENAATVQFVDGTAPSGQTSWYRVQCLGYWNGQVVVLGQTAVIAVAIP